MTSPLIVILESTVTHDCPQVEVEELRENSEEIGEALESWGLHTAIIPFTLDVNSVREQLEALKPGAVFNLVDSIEGKGNLIAMAPMLLAHMGIPYTGASAEATVASCDKLLTKQLLRGTGVATPEYLSERDIVSGVKELAFPYILKSISEHASFGIGGESVVATRAGLQALYHEKKRTLGSTWFAERYIEGREFDVSFLVTGDGPPVIYPPSEITFTPDFPEAKHRIIDYAAKWYLESPEYRGTVRRFHFEHEDDALLATLKDRASLCWNACGLSGYGRVDFRVDAHGLPYVLEVNSNPALSAGIGISALAEEAGLSFRDVIRCITADAYRRAGGRIPESIA